MKATWVFAVSLLIVLAVHFCFAQASRVQGFEETYYDNGAYDLWRQSQKPGDVYRKIRSKRNAEAEPGEKVQGKNDDMIAMQGQNKGKKVDVQKLPKELVSGLAGKLSEGADQKGASPFQSHLLEFERVFRTVFHQSSKASQILL